MIRDMKRVDDMKATQEKRYVVYDDDLKIEAYNLGGIVQKFPNHFHDFYVIGFVEGGGRHLWCKGKEYDVSSGDLILFNPKDNHFCAPVNNETLDYRALNIPSEIMEQAVYDIYGETFTPFFQKNVIYQSDITSALNDVYVAILTHASKMEKEEAFYFLMEQVLREHSRPFQMEDEIGASERIKTICTYIEEHYTENITLLDLCEVSHMSKSYLLRCFTKEMRISPYRYLQTIRIGKAKKMLENGIPLAEAAYQTGFSDQSHFSNFFKEFIGLTPGQYQKIFQNGEHTNE